MVSRSGAITVLRAVGIEQQYHDVNHAEKFTVSITRKQGIQVEHVNNSHSLQQSKDLIQTVKIK